MSGVSTTKNKTQMFCFTHAGGNASFFDLIEKDLQEFNLVKMEYAGHGVRHKEPFYNDFDELAQDVYRTLKKAYEGKEYVLFGYSMGSVALAEVLKRILSDPDMKEPARVFLAAHEPCTKKELMGFSPRETDQWVKERTVRFGAVPEKLLNNKTFWRTYLPIYRADYSIIGKYQFEKLDLRTNIPATVFYCEADTPYEEMRLWQRYFMGECDFFPYEGNHFFIQHHHEEMAEVIKNQILSHNERMEEMLEVIRKRLEMK